MADQKKDQGKPKDVNVESLEVSELDDGDLEDVSGGLKDVGADDINYSCPVTNHQC